jgi:hypothetical protein
LPFWAISDLIKFVNSLTIPFLTNAAEYLVAIFICLLINSNWLDIASFLLLLQFALPEKPRFLEFPRQALPHHIVDRSNRWILPGSGS